MNNSSSNTLIFLKPEYSSGCFNMAVDEALNIFLRKLNKPNFLRFYKWRPSCLSFGYAQRIERLIDLTKAEQHNIDVVRRMTGGKMVFHNNELTFCAGFNIDFLKPFLPENYKFLDIFMCVMQPMLKALKKVGLKVKFADARRYNTSGGVHCYSAAAGHSVFVENKKLIGAAGIIKENCITVHGSIPIKVSFPPSEIFKVKTDFAKIDITDLNSHISKESVNAIPFIAARCYADKFNLQTREYSFNDYDLKIIKIIKELKYKDLNWKSLETENKLKSELNGLY